MSVKECPVGLRGAQRTKGGSGTNTEGNPARLPMVVTLTEVENNNIFKSFCYFGRFAYENILSLVPNVISV